MAFAIMFPLLAEHATRLRTGFGNYVVIIVESCFFSTDISVACNQVRIKMF